MTKRQKLSDEPPLVYHSWNANGIDEVKIKCMMPTWEGSDLVFIQETKLNPLKEAEVTEWVKPFGYDCIFQPSVRSPHNTKWWNYGVCVFYKNVEVTQINLKTTYTEIKTPLDLSRLMMVEVSNSFIDEKIYFLNIYFPSVNSKRVNRAAERQEWAKTIDSMSSRLKDKCTVWVGDFNMQKEKKSVDDRSRMFDQLQRIFIKHRFLNVSDKLWPAHIFTRFGPTCSSENPMALSTLDYIIVSKV